mgnify:CR=1 FL=1
MYQYTHKDLVGKINGVNIADPTIKDIVKQQQKISASLTMINVGVWFIYGTQFAQMLMM